jgi:hypothetical protein
MGAGEAAGELDAGHWKSASEETHEKRRGIRSRILQAAEEGDVAEPGARDEESGEPDVRELGDEDVCWLVEEEAEGCGEGEDGNGHDVEKECEGAEVPELDGPGWEPVTACKPGDGESGEAREDIEVAAVPGHLNGNKAGEVAQVEKDFNGNAEGLEADEPGKGEGEGGVAGGDGGNNESDDEEKGQAGGKILKITEDLEPGEYPGEDKPAEDGKKLLTKSDGDNGKGAEDGSEKEDHRFYRTPGVGTTIGACKGADS